MSKTPTPVKTAAPAKPVDAVETAQPSHDAARTQTPAEQPSQEPAETKTAEQPAPAPAPAPAPEPEAPAPEPEAEPEAPAPEPENTEAPAPGLGAAAEDADELFVEVETSGQFMLMDPYTGDTVAAFGSTRVRKTSWIVDRIAEGKLKEV